MVDLSALERRLATPAAAGAFSEDEVAGLPEPVQRYMTGAVETAAPLAVSARLRMNGRLKLGTRWLPFRARETLAPLHGFVWAARVAGVITGSDHYLDGQGALNWKLFGIARVMHAEGPDVTRSAAGRGAGEAIWVPTALLPRFGVDWAADDTDHITARYWVDDVEIAVDYRLDDNGRIRSMRFDRWGDPDETGTWGLHPFGVEVTGYARFGALSIPAAGVAGWFHGTDRWVDGQFLRYRITHLDLVTEQP